jgi:hypothetical protein
MEIEQRQAEFIQQFVKEAENARGAEEDAKLIVNATAHSSVFAFSEILSSSRQPFLQFCRAFHYIR